MASGLKGLFNAASINALITQLFFTGLGALPVVLFLALLSAAAITTPLVQLSDSVSQDINLIGILNRLIVFELAPLATALLIISRSASAITIDLGNMQLRGEVEGLKLLAIDINDYLIAPRVLAGAICQLVLSTYFAVIALYGGIIIAGLLFSQRYLNFMDDALAAVTPKLLMLFVLKNLVFGIVVTATACYQALQVGTCVTELPRHTQKALVRAICLVFLINAIFLLLVA